MLFKSSTNNDASYSLISNKPMNGSILLPNLILPYAGSYNTDNNSKLITSATISNAACTFALDNNVLSSIEICKPNTSFTVAKPKFSTNTFSTILMIS